MTEMVRAGKAQDEPKTSYTRKYFNKNISVSKAHENQLEWDSNGQISASKSIIIIMAYNPLSKTEIHKSILM